MKKHSLLVAMSMALFGCASDIANGPIVPSEDGTKVEVTQPSVSQTFANGTTMKVYSPEETTTGSRAANYTGGGIISNEKPEPLSEAKVKEYQETFMKEFPAGKKNLEADHTNLKDYSSDFAMISDGKPVTIYPISVGGNARNTLGIYYYDNDGNKIEQDLWALTEDNVIGTANNGWTCLQSGDGITFTIPKGCRYGFYIYNPHSGGTSYKSKDRKDKAVSNFYSESVLNYNNQMHAVTFGLPSENVTCLAFEDLDLEYAYTDHDYNDVIFVMSPEQKVSRNTRFEIDLDVDYDLKCEVDDFALSNNVERYPDNYNIGADPDRKVYVLAKKGKISVAIEDFENLKFDETYNEYTYETWIWLNETVSGEGYIIGKEDEPDWSYSKDNYLIGVSAYKGNSSNGQTGYVKVSVHIKMKQPE